MDKGWILTKKEYGKCRNSFTELTIQRNTAKAQAKKLLEYLKTLCFEGSILGESWLKVFVSMLKELEEMEK